MYQIIIGESLSIICDNTLIIFETDESQSMLYDKRDAHPLNDEYVLSSQVYSTSHCIHCRYGCSDDQLMAECD